MVEVVFAGDWHGNLPWATSRIQSVGASGVTTILHVGDFGLWPGNSGKPYLQVRKRQSRKRLAFSHEVSDANEQQ